MFLVQLILRQDLPLVSERCKRTDPQAAALLVQLHLRQDRVLVSERCKRTGPQAAALLVLLHSVEVALLVYSEAILGLFGSINCDVPTAAVPAAPTPVIHSGMPPKKSIIGVITSLFPQTLSCWRRERCVGRASVGIGQKERSVRQRRTQPLIKIENFSVDIFSILGDGMESDGYGEMNASSRDCLLYI